MKFIGTRKDIWETISNHIKPHEEALFERRMNQRDFTCCDVKAFMDKAMEIALVVDKGSIDLQSK